MQIATLSGPSNNVPQDADAGKAKAKAINDSGGIAGHPVDLIVCEDYKQEARPKVELRAAPSTELIVRENLLAVVTDCAPRTARQVFPPDGAEEMAALIVREALCR